VLEKTFLNLDVAALDIRFGPQTQATLRDLAQGQRASPALAESLARAAADAREAYVRLKFLRSFDYDQLVAGTQDSMRCAEKSGYIGDADARRVIDGFPRWFAFLERRGVRAGDALLYRVDGDTLRTVYRAADGRVLLDQVDSGPGPRRSLLAAYLAPCSDFRGPLLRSLPKPPR
jgi:hypothetical protein